MDHIVVPIDSAPLLLPGENGRDGATPKDAWVGSSASDSHNALLLSLERTHLAWTRTALALGGYGAMMLKSATSKAELAVGTVLMIITVLVFGLLGVGVAMPRDTAEKRKRRELAIMVMAVAGGVTTIVSIAFLSTWRV